MAMLWSTFAGENCPHMRLARFICACGLLEGAAWAKAEWEPGANRSYPHVLAQLWRVAQKALQGFVGRRYPLLIGILLLHVCGRDLAVRTPFDKHFSPPNRPTQAIPNPTSTS